MRRYKAHNEKLGWRAEQLLVAVAIGRCVRFHIHRGFRQGGGARVDEGTFCRHCVRSGRAYDVIGAHIQQRLRTTPQCDPGRFCVVLTEPETVLPSSKKTSCYVCQTPAFPELIKERPNR